MGQRAVWVACVMVVCSAFASPANAQGWRWLEKLSGPGDFSGFQFDQKIWCKYVDPQAEGIAAVSLPCLKGRPEDTDEDPDWKWIRKYASGLSVSYLRATTNDLEYADTGERVDRTVQIVAFEGFYDHRLGPRIDGGVSVGLNVFIIPAAKNFVRPSFEPRLTFKLFDMRQGGSYVGTFAVRAGVHIFTKGFDAEDFGAIPGTYSSGTEIGPSVRFVFDFDRNPFKQR